MSEDNYNIYSNQKLKSIISDDGVIEGDIVIRGNEIKSLGALKKINGKTIEKSFTFDNATRSNRISQLITLLFILNKIGKEHLDLHHENVMIENSTGWIKVIDPKDREDDSDTDDLETSSDKTEIFKLIKNNILSEPTDKSNGPPKGPNKKRQKTEFNKSESSVRTMSFDGGYKQMFPIKYIQGLGPKK